MERNVGVVGLRPLLMGPPLCDRETDPTPAVLSRHVEGVRPLMAVYGDTPATALARHELGRIAALPLGAEEVTCKRAALLFALHKEPELKAYFARQERAVCAGDGPTFAEDVYARVLPFATPRFLKHSCQAPDQYVMLCLILAEMWPEPIGCWPRPEAAHHD